MHNNNTIIDPKKIAQISSTHFINIGFDLAKNIKPNINLLSYISTTMNSIANPQFTGRKVMNVIDSLKNSSAGYDFLPTKIVKK